MSLTLDLSQLEVETFVVLPNFQQKSGVPMMATLTLCDTAGNAYGCCLSQTCGNESHFGAGGCEGNTYNYTCNPEYCPGE